MSKGAKLLDAYDVKARLIPAALCAIPALVLYHYLLQSHLQGLFNELSQVRFLGYLTVEVAITYLIMQLNNRLVGKVLQDLVFHNGLYMPTTQLLMPKDKVLSQEAKREIAAKFKMDFGKELPVFKKGIAESARRQRISELTSYIRNATRDNMMVVNHNIEYGFVRNLCGGSFGALLLSLVNLMMFGLIHRNKEAFAVSTFLLILFGLIVALSKPLLKYFGSNYARVLFEQYLSKNL